MSSKIQIKSVKRVPEPNADVKAKKLLNVKPTKPNKTVNDTLDKHEKLLKGVIDVVGVLASKKPDDKPTRINKRAEVVKKVMADKKMSMIEASKYVKENNLYTK